MATKAWKYEPDCQRIDALIEQTVKDGKRPGWGSWAEKVMEMVRSVRPKAAPLVLHFISVSAAEMLEDRYDNAKLCLLVAQALTSKELLRRTMQLAVTAFAGVCNCPVCQRRAVILEKLGMTIKQLEQKLLSGTMPTMPMPGPMMEAIGQMLQGMGSKLDKLPEGVSEIELMPGFKAHIVKQALGSAKVKHKRKKGELPAPTGNPRWN